MTTPEAAALIEQIAELLAEHDGYTQINPGWHACKCAVWITGYDGAPEPDEAHRIHVASILAARLADSRPNDLQAEVNLWIEREQETHARYLRVSDEVTGLYEGVRAVMASAADSGLREPVGGHPVVTVDWLTGRLSDVLSNPDRLADSRPVVSEAAITDEAVEAAAEALWPRGSAYLRENGLRNTSRLRLARAALTAALPHMGDGKGEA